MNTMFSAVRLYPESLIIWMFLGLRKKWSKVLSVQIH